MMYQQELVSQPRRGFRPSLSFLVITGLVLAALLPLASTLVFSELQARPALIRQATRDMQNDARTRVQLIDAYFQERMLDALTLAQIPSVQQFLATPPSDTPEYKDIALHATYSLVAGILRDKRYVTWVLFEPGGQPKLSFPPQSPPKPHGKSFVPPAYLQIVRAGKSFISPVYYSPDKQKASVDIYSPVFAPPLQGSKAPPTYLGFDRATLNLDYIWNIVQEDLGKNGAGSYAFILDDLGIRIADTEATRRFKAVAPLSPEVQQQISNESRFGTGEPIAVLDDLTLATRLKSNLTPEPFAIQPGEQNGVFQAVQQRSGIVPWNYFVLSPDTTVTQVANQQLLVTALIASFAFATVVIFGLFFGRSITRPILRAVEYLLRNSQSLSSLATKQRDAASEQMWVVDSSQVGLQSVRYYTDATRIAAHQLREIGTELANYWEYADAQRVSQMLNHIVQTAHYIETATGYQDTSNQKLSTALKVATQVSEQLATGATSATDAAAQLEEVVADLRSVVGR